MPTPLSASEELRDLLLSHRLGLDRYTSGVQKEILSLYDASFRRLRRELRQRLKVIESLGGFDRGPVTTLRVQAMLEASGELLVGTNRLARDTLKAELKNFAAWEQDLVTARIKQAIPTEIAVGLELGLASPGLIREVVESRPFQGKLLGEHFEDLTKRSGRTVKRLKKAINSGLVEGQSATRIIQAVNVEALGLLRHNVAAIVQTAIAHVTGSMRTEVAKANRDIVKALQWISTLDLRTTLEWCVPRDGYTYDPVTFEALDGGPPWLEGPGRIHWNCRSDASYVLASWKELGINRKEITGATRASMDGHVPRETRAKDFFERSLQDPARRQRLIELHGKGLVEGLESGAVDFDDLVSYTSRTGKSVTLKGLAEVEGIELRRRASVSVAKAQGPAFLGPGDARPLGGFNNDLDDLARRLDLSGSEVSAIKKYTAGGYKELNRNLIDGVPLTVEQQELKDHLDSVIAKFGKLPEEVIVYRGIGLPEYYTSLGDRIDVRVAKGYKVGSTIKLDGMSSSAFQTQPAIDAGLTRTNPGIIFEIRTSRGAYLQPWTSYDDEAELLLGHGRSYKVISVQTDVSYDAYDAFGDFTQVERTVVQLQALD